MAGIEYIFFDTDLRDRFVQSLSGKGLSCETRADVMEGFVVALAVELDENTLDTLEEEYEALMNEQMLRAESRPDWVSHRVAGVPITLSDGSPCTVRLPPEVARKLVEHFSTEDVREIVTAIAHSLENPIDGPLCRKK